MSIQMKRVSCHCADNRTNSIDLIEDISDTAICDCTNSFLQTHQVFGNECFEGIGLLGRKVEVKKGQVILRHGTPNDDLFLLLQGEAVSVLRDGGVKSILRLQHEGEVHWRFSAGDYFGEDALVLKGQSMATQDVVASVDSTLFFIPHAVLKDRLCSAAGEELLEEMRIQFVARLLPSAHDFVDVDSEDMAREIAGRSGLLTIQTGCTMNRTDFLQLCLSASAPLSPSKSKHTAALRCSSTTIFVTQGAFLFKETDELHEDLEKTVGRLEVGQTLHLASIASDEKAKLSIEALNNTCFLVLVTPGELVVQPMPQLREDPEPQGHLTQAQARLMKHYSSEDMVTKFGQGASLPTVSPKIDPVKRSTKKRNLAPSTDEENKRKKTHDAPAGYASYRKSDKQLKFLKTLKPLSVSATPTMREQGEKPRCPSCPSSLLSTAVKSSPKWPTAAFSPKKRKSGLVLSLCSLEKINTLGHGAFGIVNLVRHKHSNHIFALKQMAKRKIEANRHETRACREKTIMEKIGPHPFITNFVRSFRDSDHIYLLLEAGLGGDLFDFVASKPLQSLTMDEIKFFAPQVLLALEFLHAQNVVYRDVKPENSILCVDGYLRLTDFGLAKELPNNGRTYSLCGTPCFLAPEVLTLGGYNCAIDWWAFGVFLFEVATGTFPFVAKSTPSLRGEHRDFAQSYPDNGMFDLLLDNTQDADFVNLVKQLLNPKPEKRLGFSSQGADADQCKNHPFFADVEWDAFLSRDVTPPETIFECVAASKVLAATNSAAQTPIARSQSYTEGTYSAFGQQVHTKESETLPAPPPFPPPFPGSQNQQFALSIPTKPSSAPNAAGKPPKFWDVIF